MEKYPPQDADRNNVSAADEVADEIKATTSLSVRETSRLYRLRSARFVAVIAADTEAEARELAARQDVFGGNWRDQAFAVAEFEDTTEAHVVGDVTFSASAPEPGKPAKARSRRPS